MFVEDDKRRRLLSDSNFCMTDYFIVQRISGLYAVYNLAFLFLVGCGDHSNGFMEIRVEVCFMGLNFFESLCFENFQQFLEDKFYSFFESIKIGCLTNIILGSFKVVQNGKNRSDNFFSSIQNQFRLLFERAFAIIVKFCNFSQILIL